jgi:adenylate kinase family enzyme
MGASGSGTTTTGAALAARTGAVHLDTDDFYWFPTDPPYTTARPVEERVANLAEAIADEDRWILSGSMMDWGDPFLAQIDLVVFLVASPEVRLARVLERERRRFGADIEPGGRMYAHHLEFIEYLRGYDHEDFRGRSLAKHRAWLGRAICPVLELDGDQPVNHNVAQILDRLG